MSFKIQASAPNYNKVTNANDVSLSNAIETIFQLLTEDAYITIDYYQYPLNYKCDIAYMIDDILWMLKTLRETSAGNMQINWATNTFPCCWDLVWTSETLSITSKWRKEEIYNHIGLNQVLTTNMSKKSFLNEWKKPLELVLFALEDCGYSFELYGYALLKSELSYIEEYGILYR